VRNVYEELVERGFVAQVTEGDELKELLGRNKITCYIGFDPTAKSLHAGSLVPLMALKHMVRYGHRVIVLIGGGTALIGDPSGKTEMRRIMTREEIEENARSIKEQLSRYLDFHSGQALMLNNAEWLTKLNYIEFLRDIGKHFSVNKMLAAESYRIRLEKGLNLIEFNYMLLQAYDFLHLFKQEGCLLQMGGSDQWGNILAGIDLIRRVTGKATYGLTFPLLVTSRGHKMGKTEQGTLWLDPTLTSPYDFYQYWINTADEDVEKFLSLFTLLPMEEIKTTKSLTDRELNMAKAVLAFEITKIAHGEEAAREAWKASAAAFGIKTIDERFFPSSTIPRPEETEGLDLSGIKTIYKRREDLRKGIPAYELFYEARVCSSKGEARRVITQGGGYVNDRPIMAFDEKITLGHLNNRGEILLRKGKKVYFRLVMIE